MTTQSNLHVIAIWDSPPQDVNRGIHVSIKYATALAPMNTNRQRLTNYLPAFAALLGCILCVNQFNSTAGAFSLASQDGDETAPCGIADTTGQPAIPQHASHVEAFRSDDAVSVDQRTSDFVVHVLADVAHLSVKSRNTPFNKLPAITPAFASAQCSLPSAKFRQGVLKRMAIAKRFTIGRGDERLESNVYADLLGIGSWCCIGNLNRKANKPVSAFAADNGRLYFPAGKLSVPPNSQFTNVLNAKLAAGEYETSVPVLKCERAKAITGLETRVSEPPLKETSVSPIDRAKRLLRRLSVQSRQPRIDAPLDCEPSGLFDEWPVSACCLPAKKPAFERAIVKATVCFKHRRKFTILIIIREQSVLKGSHHADFIIPDRTRSPGHRR